MQHITTTLATLSLNVPATTPKSQTQKHQTRLECLEAENRHLKMYIQYLLAGPQPRQHQCPAWILVA
jgi:hypothetical protein